ncbi:hypothetical protein [Kutzneria sp. CA-103260]|uniref:hypothetical protein n=1 Tax=Kutzneria sp. CA-103260 TaxID=2802641 RepID=UPI001BAB83C3|nr:hypothetical protein [Kutzneria sp. CA-103260]QUQ70436.1 hypothetical protein JJ691_82150 [Kutzneria sp. CA-103260]
MKPLVIVSVGWRNVSRLLKYGALALLGLGVTYLAFGGVIALAAATVLGLIVWGLVRILRAAS